MKLENDKTKTDLKNFLADMLKEKNKVSEKIRSLRDLIEEFKKVHKERKMYLEDLIDFVAKVVFPDESLLKGEEVIQEYKEKMN